MVTGTTTEIFIDLDEMVATAAKHGNDLLFAAALRMEATGADRATVVPGWDVVLRPNAPFKRLDR